MKIICPRSNFHIGKFPPACMKCILNIFFKIKNVIKIFSCFTKVCESVKLKFKIKTFIIIHDKKNVDENAQVLNVNDEILKFNISRFTVFAYV